MSTYSVYCVLITNAKKQDHKVQPDFFKVSTLALLLSTMFFNSLFEQFKKKSSYAVMLNISSFLMHATS